MTRIAFLVQAHRAPQQLSRLAACLRSAGGDDQVYIHVDAKADQAPFRQLEKVPGVHVDPTPIVVGHGGFTQVEATLRMLRRAVASGPFSHYMLLSGQCFPTKPVAVLHDLFHGDHHDFINYYPMPNLAKAKGLDRLEQFHFEHWPWTRLNGVVKRLPKRNFVKGLSAWPHAGSQWWALRHATVTQILKFVDVTPN